MTQLVRTTSLPCLVTSECALVLARLVVAHNGATVCYVRGLSDVLFPSLFTLKLLHLYHINIKAERSANKTSLVVLNKSELVNIFVL